MAKTIDEVAVCRLFDYLNDTNIVASEAQSTDFYCQNVLQLLVGLSHQHWQAHKRGPMTLFTEVRHAIHAVLRHINLAQLASDTLTPLDHVARIVGVFAAASNSDWGQSLVLNHYVDAGPNLRALFTPIPLSAIPREPGQSHWPESIPQHAYDLRCWFDKLYRRNAHVPTGHQVSVRNMNVLRDSIALLEQKVVAAFGNALYGVPTHLRPLYAVEPWVGHYNDIAARAGGIPVVYGAQAQDQVQGSPAGAAPSAGGVQNPLGLNPTRVQASSAKHSPTRSLGNSPVNKRSRRG